MTRDELIAALEAAPGPSRKLDREIAEYAGWEITLGGWKDPAGVHHAMGPDDHDQDAVLPRYTESLDAALTLVPGKGRWVIGSRLDPYMGFWAMVQKIGRQVIGPVDHKHSPAIALCIAALKAREGKDG